MRTFFIILYILIYGAGYAIEPTAEQLIKVLPPYDNNPLENAEKMRGVVLYTATRNSEVVGTAIHTFTMDGYNGQIDLLVGVLPDGKIKSVEVLSHHETIDLGSKITTPEFLNQFIGEIPIMKGLDGGSFELLVKDDGGSVDIITSATDTVRAVCNALYRAYKVYMKLQTKNL